MIKTHKCHHNGIKNKAKNYLKHINNTTTTGKKLLRYFHKEQNNNA